MAATATNESWKPGPAIAHGSSASTAAAASASRCQGSRAEPTSQASDAERARRCGTHDRRPAAHDRGVRDHRRDRATVRQRPGHAREPGQAEHRGDQEHDVAARDRQQMREPGCPERLDGAVVERRGPAQRDAGRDPARLVVAARLERGARAVAEAVEHALDAAAAPEHGQGARGQRLVHALACQPGAPVEALGGRRHRREAPADLHDRALLQRPGRAQLDRMAVEARDRGAAERAGPRLALDHEPRLLDVPDACAQRIGGARGDAVHRPGRARDRAGHGERRRRGARRDRCAARGGTAPAPRARPRAGPRRRARGSARPAASHGAATRPSSSTPRPELTARAAAAATPASPARCR